MARKNPGVSRQEAGSYATKVLGMKEDEGKTYKNMAGMIAPSFGVSLAGRGITEGLTQALKSTPDVVRSVAKTARRGKIMDRGGAAAALVGSAGLAANTLEQEKAHKTIREAYPKIVAAKEKNKTLREKKSKGGYDG
jgi:hypothetical protein